MVSEDVRLNLDQTNIYVMLNILVVQRAGHVLEITFHYSYVESARHTHRDTAIYQIHIFSYLFICYTSVQWLVQFNQRDASHTSYTYVYSQYVYA